MAWDLEHQEQVGADPREGGPLVRRLHVFASRKVLLYVGLGLIPVAIFGLMLLLAGK